jgi:di/tricarboxylate transporter
MDTNRQARGPLRAFNDYASRPPSTRTKVVAVVLAVALPLALWDKRGAAVGVVAFLVYGGVFLVGTFNHSGLVAWSRRHVALDASLMAPFAFFALAYLTTLPLWLCVLIALAVGAMFVPFAVRRRGSAQAT